MRRSEHVACIGDERNACRVLVGRAEGNRSLGIRRYRREVNIAMNLKQVMELVCLSVCLSKYAQMAVCCEYCNKMRGILDELRNC